MLKIKKYVPKIEKGVSIPKRKTKYPFAGMEVGDSFFYPTVKVVTLQSASRHTKKKTGAEFSSKEEGNGARIWRIK